MEDFMKKIIFCFLMLFSCFFLFNCTTQSVKDNNQNSIMTETLDDVSENTKQDGSYSFFQSPMKNVMPHYLNGTNWTIPVPSSYDPYSVESGNNIFRKMNQNGFDIIYIQIRRWNEKTGSLLNYVKENIEIRTRNPSVSLEDDISILRINELDFYTCKFGVGTNYHQYLYFVIWDDLVFEFGNQTQSDTALKEFIAVINSFKSPTINDFDFVTN